MNYFLSFTLALALLAAPASASTAATAVPAALPQPAPHDNQVAPYQARFGRARPVVAVVGANTGTELSDYVVPYAILAQSGAADVLALATGPGPMLLSPSLRIAPHATLTRFDQRFPEGADYVIVPAMAEPGDAALVEWIGAQAAKGATIVSICDGALVAARAGVFRGRRATGHWATRARREREFPDTTWLTNVRYVADGKAVSSAGISAAIPASLALVEAIAGRARADAVAAAIGAAGWSDRHDSARFSISAGMLATFARNKLFNSVEALAIPLEAGVDELALALATDALARTRRARAYLVGKAGVAGTAGAAGADSEPVRSRHGLDILPAPSATLAGLRLRSMPLAELTSAHAAPLESILLRIEQRYGRASAKLAADEMEYPLAPAPGPVPAVASTPVPAPDHPSALPAAALAAAAPGGSPARR